MEISTRFVLVLALFLCVSVAGLEGRGIRVEQKEAKPDQSYSGQYQPQTVGPFRNMPAFGIPMPGSMPGSMPGGLPSLTIPPGGFPVGFPFGSVPIPGGGQATNP